MVVVSAGIDSMAGVSVGATEVVSVVSESVLPVLAQELTTNIPIIRNEAIVFFIFVGLSESQI
jgi:hypothetical protein